MTNTLNADCWYAILSNVRDPKTLRGTYLTCRMFMRFYTDTSIGIFIKKKYINVLMMVIYDFPEKIHHYKISDNPLLQIGYVLEHPNNMWNWSHITNHNDLTLDIILERKELPWRWSNVLDRFDIDIKQFIIENPNLDYNWNTITKRIDDLDFIVEHSYLPWEYRELRRHKDLSWEIILSLINKDWDWYFILWNSFITFERALFIRDNFPHIPIHHFSGNPNIDYKLVQDNPDFPWNWSILSRNKSITVDDILNNPTAPWDPRQISLRGDVNIEIIRTYENVYWFPLRYTKSRNITIEDIVNNIDLNWDWKISIYENPNITIEHVYKYPDLPWDFEYISLLSKPRRKIKNE